MNKRGRTEYECKCECVIEGKGEEKKMVVRLNRIVTDDTTNVNGKITHKVLLAMKTNKHLEVVTFYVSDLGHDDIILGYTWL